MILLIRIFIFYINHYKEYNVQEIEGQGSMNIILDSFQQFLHSCSSFWNILNSGYFSVTIQLISFCILFNIIFNLTQQVLNKQNFHKKQYLCIFFIIPIVAIMVENIAWITKFIAPQTSIPLLIAYIAWIFACFKFHSIALFLEKITDKIKTIRTYHKPLFIIEILISFVFIGDYIYLTTHNQHLHIYHYMYYAIATLWSITIMHLIKIIVTKMSHQNIPTVLKRQLQVFFIYLIIPYIICLLLEFFPNIASHILSLQQTKQITAFANLGIIFITAAFYFCYQKIMLLRFLNLSDHVQIQPRLNICFTTNFKEMIEQLNFASNHQELQFITQNFFQEQFRIPKKHISLYIRNNEEGLNSAPEKIEQFLNNENLSFNPILTALSHKIFIGHEIDFASFCTDNKIVAELSKFLKDIDSDLFLPILNNKKLIGYIIVKKDKIQTIYNLEEQNKMVVFAQFLAPAIYLLSQKNIYKLMQEAKEIKEDLYAKHQEVNQYKESIKKLLKDRIENHIGIIFYKQKHFSLRNQEAQQLIGVNPNLNQSHPTTATLINIAQQVEKFKSTQSLCMTMHNGNKLIVTAMPYTEQAGGVLITVRPPEATDIIKMQLDALSDPTHRDYLLYLETTEAGKLINKLLPSQHEALLQTKIELLQAALQKNALLLQSHPDDIVDIASLIHQISLKESFHILNLQGMQNLNCATKLFGVNPLLQAQQEPALLEKFDNGTLLIKNIEHLDIVSQQKLAYFIRYGIFTPLKSEQRKFSDVRIICSTERNAQELVQTGQLTPELYKELQKSSLTLPSLLNLDQADLSDLIDGFMHQVLQDDSKQNFAPLNIKDKDLLFQKRVESISEFKKKIHNLMMLKSQEQSISQEMLSTKKSFDTATCPELQLAAQLGKDALKDSKLMSILWDKLGSQTKIADLLGVNRSSVNRRCKDYNLV